MSKTIAGLVSAILLTGTFAYAAGTAATSQFSEKEALEEASRHDMYCNEDQPPTVERIAISFRYSYEKPTDPMREQGYFIVSCAAGAYNQNSVLLREDVYEKVLRPVALPAPIKNNKGELVGFVADIVTGALSFDPKTNRLTSYSKGRGIGDMYVVGTYQLFETEVVLREYTIDDEEGEQDVAPIVKYTEPLSR